MKWPTRHKQTPSGPWIYRQIRWMIACLLLLRASIPMGTNLATLVLNSASFHVTIHSEPTSACSNWFIITTLSSLAIASESTSSKIINSVHRIATSTSNLSDDKSSLCVLLILTDHREGKSLSKLILDQLSGRAPTPKNVVWFGRHICDQWSLSARKVSGTFCELFNKSDSPLMTRNLGYLYAIHHGAKYIVEIPQDYLVADYSRKWWQVMLARIISYDSLPERVSMVTLGLYIFNPYPLLFNQTAIATMPYGVPLEYANNSYTHGTIAFVQEKGSSDLEIMDEIREMSPSNKTGIERIQKNGFVMQFFVSQRGIRDKFDALEKGEEEMTALAVPSHAFAPLSLQHAQEQSGFLLWTPLTLYIVATNKY